MIDAGSSGSRLYIYRIHPTPHSLIPNISTFYSTKITPGLSSFATNSTSLYDAHLQLLFTHTTALIPQHHHATTHVRLFATAGMRMILRSQQEMLLGKVCFFLQHQTPFFCQECSTSVQIISGVTEGVYGWTTMNYLLKRFHPSRSPNASTVAFLDMGGASAQVAYEIPSGTRAVTPTTSSSQQSSNIATDAFESQNHQSDVVDVVVAGVVHSIFSVTFLGFGSHEARRRNLQFLTAQLGGSGVNVLMDPCLPKNIRSYEVASIASSPNSPSILIQG